MQQVIATATYLDAWGGAVTATLTAQRTTRKGVPVTVYRWIAKGCACDGLAHGRGAARMVTHASRHALFTDIAVMIEARPLLIA